MAGEAVRNRVQISHPRSPYALISFCFAANFGAKGARMPFTEDDIRPYVRTVVIDQSLAANVSYPDNFLRRQEWEDLLISRARNALKPYDYSNDLTSIVKEIMDLAIEFDCFAVDGDNMTGNYYKRKPNKLSKLRERLLSDDVIFNRSQAIGNKYLRDAFSAYLSDTTTAEDFSCPEISVPAADRIVTIDHNVASKFEGSLDELIDDLQADNGLEDEPDARERLLGQMKAGRELIRAGSFRAYLLYHTLLRGLAELIGKYKEKAIGALAQKLFDLLVDKIFGG